MFIFNLLTILIFIVAILLLAVILLQEPKESVMPSGGGATAVQRVGINQKADFLEKATWVLVGLLLFLTLLSSMFLKNQSPVVGSVSPNLSKIQQAQALSRRRAQENASDRPQITKEGTNGDNDQVVDADPKSS